MSVACEISACILLFMIYEHWSLISYSGGALNTEDLFLPMKTCSRDAAVGSTQQVIARRCLLCTYWDAILAAYMPSRGFSPQNSFQLVEGRTFQILNCKAPLCCGSLNVKTRLPVCDRDDCSVQRKERVGQSCFLWELYTVLLTDLFSLLPRANTTGARCVVTF